MANVVPTALQTRILEYTGIALMLVTLGFGIFYQVTKTKLDGADLILVAILVSTFVNALRFKLTQLTQRVDELEKQLAQR